MVVGLKSLPELHSVPEITSVPESSSDVCPHSRVGRGVVEWRVIRGSLLSVLLPEREDSPRSRRQT